MKAELKREKAASGDANNNGNSCDELDVSTVMSALKFGWNACFGASGSGDDNDSSNAEISDEALDAIIDRTRSSTSAVPQLVITQLQNNQQSESSYSSQQQTSAATANTTATATVSLLQEGQQTSVTQFEEAAPLVDLRYFEGSVMGKQQQTIATMGDISTQWIIQKRENFGRERQSRLEQIHVKNVGMVSVLKANNYTLEDGEPSVYDKEFHKHSNSVNNKSGSGSGGAGKGINNKPVTAKAKRNDFDNQEYCQYCWNYGTLICCTYCPASYHPQCVGLAAVPTALYSCQHHAGCVTCKKKGSTAGFLFRCEMCPNAYCEDCLPADHAFTGVCERWVPLGYRTPTSACFIHCSLACVAFAKQQQEQQQLIGSGGGGGGDSSGIGSAVGGAGSCSKGKGTVKGYLLMLMSKLFVFICARQTSKAILISFD